MLMIRLQRKGKKNAANFRIVVAEKSAHVSKKFKEVLGNYNPAKKVFNLRNTDRLNHWLSNNISLSPTVHNLFVEKGLLKAEKVKAYSVKKRPEPKNAPAASAAPETAPVA